MERLIEDIPSGNYVLSFASSDIRPTLKNLEYQIKKIYEFEIVHGYFSGRKIAHQVYNQEQASEFEKTFENGFCCVEIYFDRPKSTNIIISSRKWSK